MVAHGHVHVLAAREEEEAVPDAPRRQVPGLAVGLLHGHHVGGRAPRLQEKAPSRLVGLGGGGGGGSFFCLVVGGGVVIAQPAGVHARIRQEARLVLMMGKGMEWGPPRGEGAAGTCFKRIAAPRWGECRRG